MSIQQNNFTEIANAIRTKKGTSNPIVANDFAEEILSIPTGGGTTEENPLYNIIDDVIKNDESGYRKKYIQLLPDSKISTTFTALNATEIITSDGSRYTGTTFNHTWDASKDIEVDSESFKVRWVMVYYSNTLVDTTNISLGIAEEVIYMVIDTIQFNLTSTAPFSSKRLLQTFKLLNGSNIHSSITSTGSSLFNGTSSLVTSPPSLNTSNLTSISSIAALAYALRSIDLDVNSATFTSANPFQNCFALVHLYLKNLRISTTISSGIAGVFINHDSLLYIINNLIDFTGQTTQTLTMGATNKAKLTPEEIAIATNKNWTIA